MQHFKMICKHCGTMISQCRCPAPDKVVPGDRTPDGQVGRILGSVSDGLPFQLGDQIAYVGYLIK